MLISPLHSMTLQKVCACTIACIVYFGLSRAQALGGALDSPLQSQRLLDTQYSDLVNSSLTHDGFEAYTMLHQNDAEVSACICVRDEGVGLLDWIAHHQKVGIRKFYVHDDYSAQPLLEVLLDKVALGEVHYNYCASADTSGHGRQMAIYEHCLASHGHRHKWMAFFDVDEFLVIKDKSYHANLPEFLRGYEEYAALAINWRMYGSSNNLLPPKAAESALHYFTKCTEENFPGNKHIKSIVQPKYIVGHGGDPHHFAPVAGRHTVASNYVKVDGAFLYPPVLERIVLNHYFSKSWTEMLGKIRRGSGDGGQKTWRVMVDFEREAVHACEADSVD